MARPSEGAESMLSREFVGYLVPTTIGFALGAMIISSMNVQPAWAYAIGFAYSIPVEIAREWFMDWYVARQKTAAVPDGGRDE